MKRNVWLLLTALAGACGGGCSTSTSTPQTAPFDPATCQGTWRQVYQSAAGELSPNIGDMAWSDGTLFVAHSAIDDYSWVFSIPDHGGSKNLLYEGHLQTFWLQGDRLIYAQDQELFDIPQTGGPPTPILHFGDEYHPPFDEVLDDTAIYWLSGDEETGGTAVWRQLRSGADDTVLATFSEMESVAPWMHQAAGQLVLGISTVLDGYFVITVPKGGNGGYESLPSPSTTATALTTATDGTVLWADSHFTVVANVPVTNHTLGRQRLDGTPTVPFSTTMSPSAAPLQAYPAGGGSWYIAASEMDKEMNSFLTLWFVQSNGTAKRVACDPTPPASSVGAVPRPAGKPTAGFAANGAFYLTVVYGDANNGGSWQVVGVDNAATAPDTGDAGLVPDARIVDGGVDLGVDAAPTCPDEDGGTLAGAGLPQYTITEFPIPTAHSGPEQLVAGPRQSLWFTEVQYATLARVTASGCIQEIPFGKITDYAGDLVWGPDGNFWITQPEIDEIGRVSPDGTMVREFSLLTGSMGVNEIALGADGNHWFIESSPDAIARITSDGTITEFPTPGKLTAASGIIAGPDGNLWFTESTGRVARIAPATGAITEFPVPQGFNVGFLAVGPDQNIWATSGGSTTSLLQITPAGSITVNPFPNNHALGRIVAGPDGNLWMTELDANNIALMSPSSGAVKEIPIPTPKSEPLYIAVGVDGNIWFVESASDQIGRVSL
jgi:streptogramin lyase